jgi:4-carboxymuconolactone decarboxylase
VTTSQRSERFERGLAVIRQIFPNQETRAPSSAPAAVRRDWGMFTVETVMGDVWARPGLSLRDRSAITVAALTALVRPEELRIHLRGALRNGLTRHELSEIILHLCIYAGAPATVEGLRTAEQLFSANPDLGAEGDPGVPDPTLPADRFERGRVMVRRIFPRGALRGLPVPDEVTADWAAFGVATAFGDIWARPGLDLRTRSRITVAALTVLHRPDELRLHLHAARNLGLSRAEICEILLHCSIYGGFPVAVEALRIAREVFDAEGRGA